MKYVPILALLFFMNVPVAFCPNIKTTFYIAETSPIISMPVYTASYDPLIKAIGHLETHNCDTLINKKEQAYGRLQIRQCRLDHYNKLTGNSYTLKDMFDFTKAKEVFLYFATHNGNGKPIKGKSYEQVAKNWNGSGPLTLSYWDAIQKLI
jgi:hypothetical protein